MRTGGIINSVYNDTVCQQKCCFHNVFCNKYAQVFLRINMNAILISREKKMSEFKTLGWEKFLLCDDMISWNIFQYLSIFANFPNLDSLTILRAKKFVILAVFVFL